MKIITAVMLMLLVCGSAFAMGGMGGAKPGTCEWKSWNCNSWNACYDKVSGKQDLKCAQDFVTACMGAECNAKKYFPNYDWYNKQSGESELKLIPSYKIVECF